MKVVILHGTIALNDAIGNDIVGMYRIFKKHYKCYVYSANNLNRTLDGVTKKELRQIIRDPENLLVYHHSIYWEEGEEILTEAKARIIFKYHNITPPSFFADYNHNYAEICQQGREQTTRLAKKFPQAIWLSDSQYNADELKLTNPSLSAVIPPFNNLQSWKKVLPNEANLEVMLGSETINLLTIGRIVPNKGHVMLLKILDKCVNEFGMDVKLNIIGKFDNGLHIYTSELFELIDIYKLAKRIFFVGEISDETLISYLLGSDFYVLTSKHEGFCVPIIESQFLRLPVIALNNTAIAETIGKEQILLNADIDRFCSAIKLLHDNRDYKNYLIEKGYKNYSDRFSNAKIEESFIGILTNQLKINL